MNERIAIIGLGKLGLATALLAAKKGYDVLGIDNSENRISAIKNLKIEIEPGIKELLNLYGNKIRFSTGCESINEVSAAFILVPTPSGIDGMFTSKFVYQIINEIKKYLDPNKKFSVCIISTVMPGTCNTIKDNLELDGFHEVEVYYSPEFVALGSILHNMQNPEVILIGQQNNNVLTTVKSFFSSIANNVPEICEMSLSSAEIAKIGLNAFVTAKISFANMLAEICDLVQGANAMQVLNSIGLDSRIGVKYFKSGLGFGGPCFPRDNRALYSFSNSIGVSADIAISTEKINLRQPNTVLNRILKGLKGKNSVILLGLSYKKDTEVFEESQSIMLANLLAENGVNLYVHDKSYDKLPLEILNTSIKFHHTLENLDQFDIIILAVPHSEYINVIIDASLQKKLIII